MIEERNDVLGTAGIHKLAHQIAAVVMNTVKIIEATGIKQGITVMMAGSQCNVLYAGLLCSCCQLICPIRCRIELFSQSKILFGVQIQAVKRPLALTQHAVKTEMNEHTETKFFKVFDILSDNHTNTSPIVNVK